MDLHRKLGTAFQSFLLAALLFAGIAVKGYSQQSAFKPAPANPSFVEYMQRVETQGLTAAPQTAGGYGLGYIPSPIDFSYLRGKRIFPQEKDFSILAFPTTYDLRTLGRLTPVRNQGIHGTCWAFATYGSLESWLLTDEVAEWNFSENNLANLHGWDLDGFLDGGLVQMAIAYLTRWSGPVNEADDTYDAAGNSRIGASTGSETVQKHVQQVLVLPPRDNPLDNDNIKDAVTNYGGVYTSMYMEYPSVYYDETNDAYYYDGAVDSNHAVVIVGWDDDFDKTKFDTEPAGNGAFIVRNSWGSAWGEGGYFYISY
ncbi:MAG: hypothetical protein JW957_05045, partial [Candidatus Omnitrophica bacterium]|nr:hypothetical protein [Candidatus Omnitrophota bacterium]